MASIELENLSHSFGKTLAIDRVSANIGSGRFLALLGPSGCGKTTLLRMIAGLERPDSGRISINERIVAASDRFVPPELRDLGMVFQSYALWPHMTVAGNISFGLNRMSRPDREARIREAMHMVGLDEMAERKPHELSGGQRQRVALARSLAARPRVLLLDEPLANLDAHLRQSMLAEFRRIHAATGCTMVLVTHDQNEAMAVADLVGVMNKGRLDQIAAPDHLFDCPANPMVARFVGNGRTLPVRVERREGPECVIQIGDSHLRIRGEAGPGPAWLCLHARDLTPSAEGIPARVSTTRYEDGYRMAEIIFDDLPEADPIPILIETQVAQGDAIRVLIRGGWVLPRDHKEHLSKPAHQLHSVPA